MFGIDKFWFLARIGSFWLFLIFLGSWVRIAVWYFGFLYLVGVELWDREVLFLRLVLFIVVVFKISLIIGIVL